MTFILAPIQIGALSTLSYSENTTFYIWAAFFNVILTFGMETAFFRFFSRAEKKMDVFSTAFISLTLSTVIFLGCVLAFQDSIATFIDLRALYFKLLLGILVLDNLVVIPFAYLRALNKPLKFSAIKIANVLILVLINLLYLWFIPNYPDLAPQFLLNTYNENDLVQYIFWANLVASGITFLLLLPYFFKTKLIFSTSIFKSLWNYGWPVMAAGIAYVINEMFDKLVIKEYISEEIMGAYAGCYKLAIFMAIYIQAFRLGAEPFFFNQYDNKDAKLIYAEILKYFVIAGSLILLFLVVFIDFFKALIVPDEEYWITIGIVPVILLANLFLGIYHNLSIWYKLTDKTKIGMYISIMGAMITIGLNLWLVPIAGFMAAAWATLAAYGSMMLLSYYLGRKYYPIPYNLKKIGGYLLVSVVFSIISFYFFRENYVLGSVLILLFFFLIYYFERDRIDGLLNPYKIKK
jgi:O-antigen/teichoic acid export membrane protein